MHLILDERCRYYAALVDWCRGSGGSCARSQSDAPLPVSEMRQGRRGGSLIRPGLMVTVFGLYLTCTTYAVADMVQAVPAAALLRSVGVNTHIDYTQIPGYKNLDTVIRALKYLGVANVRDRPNADDLGKDGRWQRVAAETGVTFDAVMPEGSDADMQGALPYAEQAVTLGLAGFIEGGNEEDDPYARKQGNSLHLAAMFQKKIHATAHALAVPTINISFGQGWRKDPDHGDYGKVGDLSAFCDYANAHTYPSGAPFTAISNMNFNANLAASRRPVITTEFGYDRAMVPEKLSAPYMLDGVLDSFQSGDPYIYIYALFDDATGEFGLMKANGEPRLAGTAIHNFLFTMADKTGPFHPERLDYTVDAGAEAVNSILFRKTDGSLVVAVWNESRSHDAVHASFSLHRGARSMAIYDPMKGVEPISTYRHRARLGLRLTGHPLLIVLPPVH